MRFTKHLAILATVLSMLSTSYAQTGCPGCEIALPDLPEDTLYLAPAPNGQINQPYDEDISFRLPKTTDPVHEIDPETPAGFDINQFVITGVSNLPPGLDWEVSQDTYVTADETDGCVKFCGTPLQPGLYQVGVNLVATVLVFEQETSFTFELLILPNTSTTDGFTILNNTGCGEVVASFENNIPSNGVDGFSYDWDFGNGNTSIDENPSDQIYSSPGVYAVSYEAVIDTSPYLLNQVQVQSVSCNDILGGSPDLYVEISDPDGNVIFQPDPINNASTPLNFFMNLPIGEGTYTLRVIDDDGGLDGSDDVCGVINFTQLANGQFNDTDMTLSLNIMHHVDTIHSMDSVYVYAQPPTPLFSGGDIDLCMGEMTILHSATYENSIQWFTDSIPIQADTLQDLQVEESGNYFLSYTSEDGCIVYSEAIDLVFHEVPPVAPFMNTNNLLELVDPGSISVTSILQWFHNGTLIPSAGDAVYCISASGEYSLQVTDVITGCSSIYTAAEEYDENFPDCTTAVEELVFDKFKLFPNPTNSHISLQIEHSTSRNLTVKIANTLGQELFLQQYENTVGEFNLSIDLSQYSTGLYFIQLQADGKQKTLKVLKK